MDRIKKWARMLKRKVFLLYFAYKDSRTPWYAKIFAICVVAYAFSPIDLIPDFIPVLGYLDDVILVPLGIAITLKMIPEAVVQEHELQAEERMKRGKPKNWFAGSMIIVIWIAAVLWISLIAYRHVLNQ
ncbi:YkvA family protein [Paenibacillus sp. FSL W8-0187]|uniref:YkvA family protein n=1 Tax=unclassified Paenibacillus TaxID=185978 RepID=UPI0030D7226D